MGKIYKVKSSNKKHLQLAEAIGNSQNNEIEVPAEMVHLTIKGENIQLREAKNAK